MSSYQLQFRKDENKEIEAGIGPFKKKLRRILVTKMSDLSLLEIPEEVEIKSEREDYFFGNGSSFRNEFWTALKRDRLEMANLKL